MNDRNLSGQTPLHAVAGDNNEAVVRFYVELGADVSAQDRNGQTPLHLAAERIDNDDVIDLLLSHGADVSLKDNKGRTALHLAAAQFSNTKAIDLLLQHHPGINLQDELGQTALHLAADTRNNIKNIESLVNAGVNTNLQDLKGRTALHLAVGKEHNETVIDFLLLSGAHINTLDNEQRPSLPNSENRLREAIENNQKDITEALLDGGVDGVSGRPGYGQKALGFSVARGVPGKEMAFWLLLRKGVSVNTANGHKALLLASDWWEKWDKANYALRALLSPSDPSKELFELIWKVNLGMEVEGETIIYRLLAERKYPHVIWALLRTDDVRWPTARVAKRHLTHALPFAARNELWSVARQLVEKGADTNVNVGNVSLLAFMKDGKQVPDCGDCDSGSPCTYGIHKGYRDLLELVSGRGAVA